MKTKMMIVSLALGLAGYSQMNAAKAAGKVINTMENAVPKASVTGVDVKPYQETNPGKATKPEEPKVTVFQGCSNGGWSASFGVGKYTLAELVKAGVTKNQISSVTVPDGLKVTLYKSEDLTGESTVLTSSKKCLVDIGFNDNVSSIVVSKN
ncbi:hypothetical protein [Pedobacter sp. BMA]|uniref:hypothetical protein n=1 Tax=Pedobacter sp. BMA TaxID=1663685 RepID=UPI0006493D81|nr:hypothetical protein [Pedobacter sp. BMA]KLT67443.1 hypothetical protein AB669_01745 [Pedobacter sp. BMA]